MSNLNVLKKLFTRPDKLNTRDFAEIVEAVGPGGSVELIAEIATLNAALGDLLGAISKKVPANASYRATVLEAVKTHAEIQARLKKLSPV